ncbi:NAD(P)-dependent oxidoreductase [Candidatus Pelagibacter sp. HIMB1506]|jgi:phosphoglycerate dehydrogenase-like enzyme|uniref:NAD(P)-dependent oxidoreductase n=1 Tax=unclassified Candidatus Pelagibacter TaxID=2647897 RepID=UPI003F85384E|tara:strand:+ start:85 stop:1107 length:1023 start_codon:yes stop_codon:yes gene_type:complete
MKKLIVISDPFPRTLDLIFTKKKLKELKTKYTLIVAPSKNKKKFYESNIHKASFIMGQPDLDKKLLSKAIKLKAIINVESNFMNNVDYKYCHKRGIHVIATSPVFSKPVAEIALGMTLSLLRNIHEAHFDFLKGKEKYGLESNLKASMLSGKKIGLLGFGDLAKSLYPLLLPFTKDISVYDPWLPKNVIKRYGFQPINLKDMFSKCEVIYVLAAVTTENKNLIDKKLLNRMKPNTLFILMSRAAVVNFKDLVTRLKKGDIYVATDVFPEEPVRKNDPIRKVKNILFSAHRAGALKEAFFDMGNIVLKDMDLILKNQKPKYCKKAQLKTVELLSSKPVSVN